MDVVGPENEDSGSSRRAKEFAKALSEREESSPLERASLPRRGLALGGVSLAAAAAWLLLREGEPHQLELQTTSTHTEHYLDWSADERFQALPETDLRKAGLALYSGKWVDAFQNLAAASSPMETGLNLVVDSEGEEVMRFQLVRKVNGNYDWDGLRPDRVEYELALENIPGSPYSFVEPLNSSLGPHHRDLLKDGKVVARVLVLRDQNDGRIESLLFVDLNLQPLLEFTLGSETRSITTHSNFIRKNPAPVTEAGK